MQIPVPINLLIGTGTTILLERSNLRTRQSNALTQKRNPTVMGRNVVLALF